MKRLLCICMVLLLCTGICGCQKQIEQPKALPPLPADGVDVEWDEGSLHGKIAMILSPDVIELKVRSQREIEQYGEKVYIVAKEADEWCIGDEIEVKFRKVHRPKDSQQYVRIFADEINAYVAVYKPIIYFYPEMPTVCSAKLTLNGKLTCTYPVHGDNGWENFIAYPDGTLVFPDGKEYYALYWEGQQNARWDFSEGFCVRGEDTATFLEWALAQQGLTPREANEFIVYWLPLLQENPYNVISFQGETYTDGAKLHITPAPDSVLRVFMAYRPSDVAVEIEPQTFQGFVREGFTVVEWGGGPA